MIFCRNKMCYYLKDIDGNIGKCTKEDIFISNKRECLSFSPSPEALENRLKESKEWEKKIEQWDKEWEEYCKNNKSEFNRREVI